MPPTSTRGRRGRGRSPWKRDVGHQLPLIDAELESQQQQSSNRTLSVRESDAKAEEKTCVLSAERYATLSVSSGNPVAIRRGGKRKGRPPSRGGRGRGRLSREPPVTQERRSGGGTDFEAHGSSAAHESVQRIEGASLPSMGRARRRVAPTKLRDMDVESEGENDVSDVEGLRRRTDSGHVGSSARERTTGDHSAKKEKRREEEQVIDYPFPIYTDGRGTVRIEHGSFVLPICVGSIAFWLGKE